MTPTDHWSKACTDILRAMYHIDQSCPNEPEWRQLMGFLLELQEAAYQRQPKALRRLPQLEEPGGFIE